MTKRLSFDIEVLQHLDIANWKTSRELHEEMSARWERENRRAWLVAIALWFSHDEAFVREMFQHPSVPLLVVALSRLQDKKLVEARYREPGASVVVKALYSPRQEWHLTDNGRRRRNEQNKSTAVAIDWGAAPA